MLIPNSMKPEALTHPHLALDLLTFLYRLQLHCTDASRFPHKFKYHVLAEEFDAVLGFVQT